MFSVRSRYWKLNPIVIDGESCEGARLKQATVRYRTANRTKICVRGELTSLQKLAASKSPPPETSPTIRPPCASAPGGFSLFFDGGTLRRQTALTGIETRKIQGRFLRRK
jgi:hypothetical protein